MSSREGKDWEGEVIDILRKEGWMCGLIPSDTSGGQPFDIWAFKGVFGMMVECKVLHSHRFPLHRIEPNQIANMRLARVTRSHGMIYIKSITEEGVQKRRIDWYWILDAIDKGQKSINLKGYQYPEE